MSAKVKPYSLLVADDSILVVIDVQDAFLKKLPAQEGKRLLNHVCWIVKLAQWKQIPLVVTAEELAEQPLAVKLTQSLSSDIQVFNKLTFGLVSQSEIFAAVKQTKRKTAVLVGLETDVCVTHSAIGLLEKGYRVAVVADAVGSPAPGQEMGLNRMKNAGVIIVNMKSLFYEWLRTVDETSRFHRENPEMRDSAGIVL